MARRKNIRKEEFGQLPNCFNKTAEWKGKWRTYFENDHPIILELGCGKAELSYTLAKQNPEINYIGIDLKPDRLWHPSKQALEEGVSNIALLCINLLDLADHFAENEVDGIWITFPDPFPKNRQAKHRMINPAFLKGYQNVLKPGGLVQYKTDNLSLFHYSLETFVKTENIRFKYLTFDLHEALEISENTKIETTYEKKFREMGVKINYVSFVFIPQ